MLKNNNSPQYIPASHLCSFTIKVDEKSREVFKAFLKFNTGSRTGKMTVYGISMLYSKNKYIFLFTDKSVNDVQNQRIWICESGPHGGKNETEKLNQLKQISTKRVKANLKKNQIDYLRRCDFDIDKLLSIHKV